MLTVYGLYHVLALVALVWICGLAVYLVNRSHMFHTMKPYVFMWVSVAGLSFASLFVADQIPPPVVTLLLIVAGAFSKFRRRIAYTLAAERDKPLFRNTGSGSTKP